jgi:hypothetical protein
VYYLTSIDYDRGSPLGQMVCYLLGFFSFKKDNIYICNGNQGSDGQAYLFTQTTFEQFKTS